MREILNELFSSLLMNNSTVSFQVSCHLTVKKKKRFQMYRVAISIENWQNLQVIAQNGPKDINVEMIATLR